MTVSPITVCICCYSIKGGHTHQLSLLHLEPARDAWETLYQCQRCSLHPQALQKQITHSLVLSYCFTRFEKKNKIHQYFFLMCTRTLSLADGTQFNYGYIVRGKHVKCTYCQTPTFRCRSDVMSYISHHHSCSCTYPISQHACQYASIPQGHSDST